MKWVIKILYLPIFFFIWSGNTIQGQTIFDFLKEAPKAKWQAYQFQRFRGNHTIPFNGNTTDKKGYVKVTRKLLEDGSTKKVLQLHPSYPTTIVASGTYGSIRRLPANAEFRAKAGFLENRRTSSNNETHFGISIHYSENGKTRGRPIWTSSKKYTGQLEEIKVSLAEFEGKEVYFSFVVNNKRNAKQDIAVWENPVVLINQASNDEISAGPNVKKTLNLLEEMADAKWAALIETPENPFGAVDVFKGNVYYDKNEKSGVFYYLPGHFSLDWDQDKGAYQFDITYPEDGSGEKNVQVSAQFSSSINSEMADLLERIVSKVTNRRDVQVRPFPLGAAPKVTFPFAEYNIAQSDITLNQFSDFSKPMSVSWSMSPDDVEAFVVAMAKRVYFDGHVSWQVKDLDTQIEVPIHFSLIASKTIGQFYYSQMGDLFYKGFQNNTAFRLKLKSIKALNKVKGSPLIFEEVLLPNTIVEPYTTFKDFSAKAKINLNTYPAHLLLDYEIIPCEECEANAVRSVLKNGLANLEQTVEIWDLGATKFTKALAIKLEVKELAISINVAEGERIEKAFEAPRLLDGQLTYKYKVTIVLPNGPLTSRTIKGSETSIYLTEDFIKEHFEEFRN